MARLAHDVWLNQAARHVVETEPAFRDDVDA
jgi:hypothetical protein